MHSEFSDVNHPMGVMMKKIIATIGFAAILVSLPANATLIIGGSALLDPAGANQLESWLGTGPVTLTNIFTKGVGSTSLDFHAAADGMGATFSVMNVTLNGITKTIGGYNPQSWSSSSVYNIVANPADRTAFVFNLSDLALYIERADSVGQYQTGNWSSYGPTFGGGHDIWVSNTLTTGYSYLYSYGADATRWQSIVDGGPSAFFSVNSLEVFTVAAAAVPEPGTYPLLLTGLCLIGFTLRRAA